mgnify:CR=1 FL=1
MPRAPRTERRVPSADPRGHLIRQHRGRAAERLACAFLRHAGYEIERTNVRFPVGEIDIVARQGGVLCFVEVRSTSSQQWGGAVGSITDRKRRHLIRAARWYLTRYRSMPPDSRFDVVAIEWQAERQPKVELIQGAFDASR